MPFDGRDSVLLYGERTREVKGSMGPEAHHQISEIDVGIEKSNESLVANASELALV